MSDGVQIKVEPPNWFGIVETDAGKAAERSVELSASDGLVTVKRYSPFDTGELEGSWRGPNKSRAMRYIVGSDAPQSEFTAEGTKPHIIRPVNAKVLAWESGGSMVFAMIVNHPGTAKDPYIDQTIREVGARNQAHINAAYAEVGPGN